MINMSEKKKRYTVSFTPENAEKFEELVQHYGIQKSGLLTLLIREEYQRKIEGKENEQKK